MSANSGQKKRRKRLEKRGRKILEKNACFFTKKQAKNDVKNAMKSEGILYILPERLR